MHLNLAARSEKHPVHLGVEAEVRHEFREEVVKKTERNISKSRLFFLMSELLFPLGSCALGKYKWPNFSVARCVEWRQE